MGFTEILTIIFIVLKLTGTITWSWVQVFILEIIALLFYVAIVIDLILGAAQEKGTEDDNNKTERGYALLRCMSRMQCGI